MTSPSTTTTISTVTRTFAAETSIGQAARGSTTRNIAAARPIGTGRPRIGLVVRRAESPRPTARLAPGNRLAEKAALGLPAEPARAVGLQAEPARATGPPVVEPIA
jgi:hypothetical protein